LTFIGTEEQMNIEQGMLKERDIDNFSLHYSTFLGTEAQISKEQGMLKDGDIDDSITSLFNIPCSSVRYSISCSIFIACSEINFPVL
jgi:hypothetical protein